MHILCLHQHFATDKGRISTRSYELAQRLLAHGHRMTVICGRSNRSGLPPKTGPGINEYCIDGIRVLVLPVPYRQNMGYIRRLYAFFVFMLWSTGIALRQRQIDVVFAISTPLTIGIPAMIVSSLKHVPFVFEVRDLWPEVPIRMGILRNRALVFLARRLEYAIYRRAEHIVTLSPGMTAGVLRQGISPGRVTTIPSWCINELFDVPPSAGEAFRAQYPPFAGRPLVVYTGAYGAANDLSYLVRLAADVYQLDPQVAFLMVGDGTEDGHLRALASDLGVLDRNLWMVPPLPKEQIPSVLSAATMATSIFINNEVMWSNSANKFFDALAAGRPVAINYRGWQADVLRESGAGLVLHATDTAHAAAQLVDALCDREWLARAGEAARQLATTQYAKDQLAAALEHILLDAAH